MSANAETLERQAAKLIPELWSLSLNKKLDKSGVGMKIVNKIYEKDIKNYGDTVHIGEIGDVTISDYSEDESDGGVTYQRVDATSQDLKIDQSKSFGIFLSDITQKQSNIKDLQAKFEARAKTAVDLVKDTFILSAFSEIPAENKKGTDTAITLTKDNAYQVLVWLAKTLKNNNAVQTKNDQVFKSNQAAGEAMPYVVINPDVEAILIQSPDFIHATNAGDRVLREGSIGTIAGLEPTCRRPLAKSTSWPGSTPRSPMPGISRKLRRCATTNFSATTCEACMFMVKRSFCRKPWPAWSLMCRRLIILIARPVAAVSRKMM